MLGSPSKGRITLLFCELKLLSYYCPGVCAHNPAPLRTYLLRALKRMHEERGGSIHTYSFITQNDRTHLHKIKTQVKNTNKSSRVKTVIKQLIRVFEQHAVNKIPFARLTGDNT